MNKLKLGVERKASEIFKSSQWIETVKAMCAGNIEGADAKLQTLHFANEAEKTELHSILNFQRGITIGPHQPSLLIDVLWSFAIKANPLASLFFGLFAVLPFRTRIFRSLYKRWMPRVAHYRYVDFKSGLVFTSILKNLCPSKFRIDKAYLLGLQGHFLGMSGCFQRSLKLLKKSVKCLHREGQLPADEDRAFYARHLEVEIACIYALHLTYAGFFTEAKEAFESALELIKRTPYWWFEIFLRSMRQNHCIETVDEKTLQGDTQALKQLIGPKAFHSKYALRTVAASALLAAIQKQMRIAGILAINARGLYKTSKTNVEMGRYHFMLALINLEFNDFESARINSMIAEGSFLEIKGGRYHKADAMLLAVEIQIRTLIALPASLSKSQNLSALKKKLSIAARLLPNCEAIKARAAFFEAVIDELLLGHKPKKPYRKLLHSPYLSARIKRSAEDFDQQVQANRSEDHRNRVYFDTQQVSLEILEDFLDIINNANAIEGAASYFKTILGSDHTEVVRQNIARQLSVSKPSISRWDEGIEVNVPLRHQVLIFRIFNPLVDLSFEVQSENMVLFGALILQMIESQRQAEKDYSKIVISEMATMIAHDMRSPIGTFERLLLTRDEDIPSMKPTVKEAVNRLFTMVEALRHGEVENIVRQSWGVLSFGFGYESLLGKAESRKVRLRIPVDRIEKVYVDHAKIERSWINLASNAIEFAASFVDVEVRVQDKDLIIRVIDDGPGVAEDILPRLFERGATYGKLDGTGLGLAYVKQIMQGHGGEVRYRREGLLSIFECFIPSVVMQEKQQILVTEPSEIGNLERCTRTVAVVLASSVVSHEVFEKLASVERDDIRWQLEIRDDCSLVITDQPKTVEECFAIGIAVVAFKPNTPASDIIRRSLIRLGISRQERLNDA